MHSLLATPTEEEVAVIGLPQLCLRAAPSCPWLRDPFQKVWPSY